MKQALLNFGLVFVRQSPTVGGNLKAVYLFITLVLSAFIFSPTEAMAKGTPSAASYERSALATAKAIKQLAYELSTAKSVRARQKIMKGKFIRVASKANGLYDLLLSKKVKAKPESKEWIKQSLGALSILHSRYRA